MNPYNINTVLICLCLLIAGSLISITLPISEQGIPFTGQSLAVFCIAGILTRNRFLIVILLYLFLGICGLPVFADGSSGFEKITGSSGGFLYGFVFAGFVISFLLELRKEHSFLSICGIMLIGTIVLFIFGLGHLSVKFGFGNALEFGLYPFWQMSLLKAFLATFIVFGVKRLMTKE